MQRAVELLLVVGILVNLIKGADLILRPYQQKWLQDKFDTLTLKLDYSRPLDWYVSTSRKRIYWISIGVFIVGLYALSFLYEKFVGLGELHEFRTGYEWIICSVLFLILLMRDLIKYFRKRDKEEQEISKGPERSTVTEWIIGWVMSSNGFAGQILRVLLMGFGASMIVIVSFYVLALYLSFLIKWLLPPGKEGHIGWYFLLAFPGTFLLGFVLIFSLRGVVASFFIITLSIVFLLTELLLKCLRAIFWRIAEYNKGAFAAIVLLVTIVLGITELYLKTRTLPVSSPTAPAQTSPSTPNTLDTAPRTGPEKC